MSHLSPHLTFERSCLSCRAALGVVSKALEYDPNCKPCAAGRTCTCIAQIPIERITDAIDELNKEVKNVPYLVEMVQKIGLGLSDMEKLDKAAIPQLNTFVQTKPPTSLLIFKKIPGTEVKLHGN